MTKISDIRKVNKFIILFTICYTVSYITRINYAAVIAEMVRETGLSVDEKMRHQEISNEYYKFWFNTYDNEALRRLQLWFIHSELEQATGRARLLRFNCIVKLFANLPLEQAEII